MILNMGCPVLDRAHHSCTQVTTFELEHYRGPTRDLTGSQGGPLSWRLPPSLMGPNGSQRGSPGIRGAISCLTASASQDSRRPARHVRQVTQRVRRGLTAKLTDLRDGQCDAESG